VGDAEAMDRDTTAHRPVPRLDSGRRVAVGPRVAPAAHRATSTTVHRGGPCP
jgi:hypothetical protein